MRAERLGLGQLGELEIEQDALREQEQDAVLGSPVRGMAAEAHELDGPGTRAAPAQRQPSVDPDREALERHAHSGVEGIALPDRDGALVQLEELRASVPAQGAIAEPLPQPAARRAATVLDLPQAVARGDESPRQVEVRKIARAHVRDAVDVGGDGNGGREPGEREAGVAHRRVGGRGPDRDDEERQESSIEERHRSR